MLRPSVFAYSGLCLIRIHLVVSKVDLSGVLLKDVGFRPGEVLCPGLSSEFGALERAR
jgi:hypothetical protein